MKSLILFFQLICVIPAYTQYTYFNNVYFGLDGGTLQTTIFSEVNNSISLGLSGSRLEYRRINDQGITIQNAAVEVYPYIISAPGNSADAYLKSPQGFISRYDHTDTEECPIAPSIVGCVNFDTDFNVVWEKHFSEWNNCDSLHHACVSFCSVDDSSFAMLSNAAFKNGHGGAPDSSGWRITRMKYSSGEVLEDEGHVHSNHVFAMSQIRYVAGHYFILGYVVPFEGTTQNPSDYQTLIYKVTSQGNVVGQLDFGNPQHCFEQGPQMEITHDNQIILFYNYCHEMYPVLAFPGNIQKNTPHHVIIDPTSFTASNDMDYDLPGDEWRGSIAHLCTLIDSDSSYLDLAFYRTFPGDTPDLLNVIYQGSTITKFSSQGVVMWQNQYFSDDYGAPMYAGTTPFDMVQTPDGGYLCNGVSYNDFYQKHWLLKIDNCGYEQPSGCPAVVGFDDNNASPQLQLWPNPFDNQLKAVLPQNTSRIFITDMTGRTVMDEKVYFPNQQFDVSQLSKGVYLFNVVCDDGRVMGQRVVKLRSTG